MSIDHSFSTLPNQPRRCILLANSITGEIVNEAVNTMLRLIAGLERPDAGQISINGQTVAFETHFTPPEKRGVGMVFQDYALFPHLNVFDNIAFGLHGKKSVGTHETVREMLALVGLGGLANRYPHDLSGGE